MSPDCVFCKIVKGEIPSHKVHEDAATFAFLDIHPLARGHTLVVPKRHAARLQDVDPKSLGPLFAAVHALTPRVCKAVKAPAATIAINDGRESGQEVPHLHVHIVPRTAGDGAGPIHALFPKRPTVKPDEFAPLAEQVRQAIPPAP